MIRTGLAVIAAALLFAAVAVTAQAAPIAPLPGAAAADSGQLTQVYWYHHHHHHHCWRGHYGHWHCGW